MKEYEDICVICRGGCKTNQFRLPYCLPEVGYFCKECDDIGEYSSEILTLTMQASLAIFASNKETQEKLARLRDEEVPKLLEEWKEARNDKNDARRIL